MFKRPIFVVLAMTAALSLALAGCGAPALAPTEAAPVAPAATLAPPAAPPSTDTPAPTATATTAPTAAPTAMSLPQTWNGRYIMLDYNVTISLIIDKMNGDSFTGKMVWGAGPKGRGAITRMNGQFVNDFGDAAEQAKWNNLPAYKSGDQGGTWIKWTETEMIQGGGYTMNGWYFGHIAEDGTATGIYYYNDQVSSLGIDSWTLKTK